MSDSPFPRTTNTIAAAIARIEGPDLHPLCSDVALAITLEFGRWRVEECAAGDFMVTTDAELDVRTGQPPTYFRDTREQAETLRTLLSVSAALHAYDHNNVVSITTTRRRRARR